MANDALTRLWQLVAKATKPFSGTCVILATDAGNRSDAHGADLFRAICEACVATRSDAVS